MLYHTYPQPIGKIGVNRVDARDVADAAVNALLHSEHDGRDYAIHGDVTFTGDDVAAVFGRHLKEEVRYGGDDLGAWAKQAQHMMPAWMVQDLRVMYEYFQHHGLVATAEELAQQQQVVGHAPRPFDSYVDEILPAWRKHLEEGTHYRPS